MTAKKAQTAPPLPDEDEPASTVDEFVLDLEEYVDPKRPTIRFRTEKERAAGEEGGAYELRVPEDMGVAEEQLFRTELNEYATLSAPGTRNKAEKAKLETRIDHLFRRAILAPKEIMDAFNDAQKKRVIKAFQIALLTEDAAGVEEALKVIQPQQARDSSITES